MLRVVVSFYLFLSYQRVVNAGWSLFVRFGVCCRRVVNAVGKAGILNLGMIVATMCPQKRGVDSMATNTVVRVRIDGNVKEEASVVLAAMGLTLSDAVRLLLTKVANEKALPFEPLTPNAETIAAMKAARRGDLVTVGSVEELLGDLHADD